MSSTASVQNQRKRRYKKKSYKGKKNLSLMALKKANKAIGMIKQELEVKNIEQSMTIQPLTSAPSSQRFGYPGQSITNTGRIGNDISLIDIAFKGNIYTDNVSGASLGAISNASMRLLLVQDRDGASTLTASEVLAISGAEPHYFRNPFYTKRFKILYDNTWVLNRSTYIFDGTTHAALGVDMYIEYYHKFKKPIKIQFNDTTTTSMQNDTFFLLGLTAENADNSPTFFGNGKIRYTDA